jgi:hypothetical protein
MTLTDPSGGDAVVIVNEDSAVLPSSGNCDAMILPALEPAQVMAVESLLPATEMPVPSPMVEVQDPPPAVEVAESSSAPVALTTEEVMELATCRYIDFPSVGVIDLEAPQLPEEVYEVAAERMFNESTIMETIASVSKVLQEYAHRRFRPNRCSRRGRCGPRGAHGSREADNRCVHAAADR